MAGPRVSQSTGYSRWKQWWRRSPNTSCNKTILLLLVWQALFSISWSLLATLKIAFLEFLSFTYAPFIGWLADVRFGRYKVIKFGSITSSLVSILYFLAMIFNDI